MKYLLTYLSTRIKKNLVINTFTWKLIFLLQKSIKYQKENQKISEISNEGPSIFLAFLLSTTLISP